MNLGAAIKEIRKAKHLTRKDVAAAAGISVTGLFDIETEKSRPGNDTLQRLCQALDVPMSYILAFSVTEDDVPEEKRTVFRQIMPLLKQFLIPKKLPSANS